MDQTMKSYLIILLAILCTTELVTCQDYRDLSGMLHPGHCATVKKVIEAKAISKFQLRFRYGLAAEDFIAVPLNESASIFKHPKYNSSTCMVVFMTGWLQKVDSHEIEGHSKDFVEYCGCNYILVDWTATSTNPLYRLAVAMTPNAAKAIARSLDALIDAGATLCYLCGISLGGQGAGLVARNMKNRVKHLIAFDPAGPLFYEPLKCVPHLTKKDADCVEVIHTDKGMLGAPVKTGTRDYWVNGGTRVQPGCLEQPEYLSCSHLRSQVLFMQSLRDDSLFPARQCSSKMKFDMNRCSGNPISYIGKCNDSASGNYYLRTSGRPPYGLKLSGTYPHSRPE